MTPYSDTDLESMMADPESDLVERKATFDGQAPTTVRQAICAFANDLPDHRRPGVRYGAGIPLARRALRDNDQAAPEFQVDAKRVVCTLRVRS